MGAAERLSAYWDTRANREEAAARGTALDRELIDTIEHLHSHDDARLPDPRFLMHLEATLLDAMTRAPGLLPVGTPRSIAPNGRVGSLMNPPRQVPGARRWSRLLPSWLATAALVLLTLVGTFVALRGSLLLPDPDQRAIIPAIDGTLEPVLPPGVIADDLLLRATIEQMPSAQSHQIALNRFWLAPGATQPVGSQADTGVGLVLFTVEAGRVTVEPDAPVMVTRAEANPTTALSLMPTGTAIVLDEGDQLYAPDGVSFRRRNDGLTPATVLDFSIGTVGRVWRGNSLPEGVTFDTGTASSQPATYPTVPAEAEVHRLTLAPGAELAVRDLPGLVLVDIEAGDLDLVSANAETSPAPERDFTIHTGIGSDVFHRLPDRAVLANRGAGPVVILTASVVSTNADEATPEAVGANSSNASPRPP